MQHRITERSRLLDKNGHVTEPGWATDLLLEYRREDVLVDHNQLREWDYYLTTNSDYGVAFSIADTGKITRLTANFLNFKTGEHYTDSEVVSSNLDFLAMPEKAFGQIKFKTDRVEGSYTPNGNKVKIEVTFKKYFGKTLYANLELELPDYDAMVVVTPFDEGEELFYYNYKLNNIRPKGVCKFGDEVVEFNHDTSFTVYDWGRGVWPSTNVWYWGSGSGRVDGVDFGFNIGYGFGNLDAATENMIFYDGKCHKFDEIKFNIPEDSYMKPWTFTSSDGRFEMDFKPILDRFSGLDKKDRPNSVQHQVFGEYTGTAILDDGTKINIENFFGFAEEVKNYW